MALTEAQAWSLASLDAVETAARVKRGELSRGEVVEAAIVRAGKAKHLNAVVTETFEKALAEAPGRTTGPFAGVPTFTKDLAQVAGVRTTWGSSATGHFISKKSDPSVLLLEQLGLVSLGKSSTPEFGLTGSTEFVSGPATLNPHDLTRTAGGSSGGAGALVAAGVVPLAHGSDGGGSIRIPASWCGVVGFKPSRGRLDMEASPLLPVNVAVHGCLTRTVRDTVAFWQGIDGLKPVKLPRLDVVNPAPVKPLKVGVVTANALPYPVDAEVVAATQAMGQRLERLGHQVEAIACPWTTEDLDDFLALWAFLGVVHAKGGSLLIHRGFDASRLEPWTLSLAKWFTANTWEAAKRMRRLRGFTARWAEFMKGWSIIVLPTLAIPAPKLGHLRPDVPFDEKLERLRAGVPFTGMLNAAGAPSISMPTGRTASGLPIGVQLAGALGDDRTVLELALQVEADAALTIAPVLGAEPVNA